MTADDAPTCARLLSKRLYAVLENGVKLSDDKSEVDASDMPEFIVECALNGYA